MKNNIAELLRGRILMEVLEARCVLDSSAAAAALPETTPELPTASVPALAPIIVAAPQLPTPIVPALAVTPATANATSIANSNGSVSAIDSSASAQAEAFANGILGTGTIGIATDTAQPATNISGQGIVADLRIGTSLLLDETAINLPAAQSESTSVVLNATAQTSANDELVTTSGLTF